MEHFRRKVGYGLGDMASSMFWKIFSYYLPFFYANIYGLTLVDAGILVLVTRIWDAVSDPVMGLVADRTNSRWGRFRPWILWVSLPFAVCGVLMFYTPEWSYSLKLIWAYVTYLMMMTVYTGINVPYGAMISVITDNTQEKTVYASYRMFFAYGGSFIALMSWEPLCSMFENSLGFSSEMSWNLSMVVVASACLILFMGCFCMTKEVVSILPAARNALGEIKALLRNRPWLILVGAALAFNFFATIRGATIAFFFADVIGADAAIRLGSLTVMFYAGLFLGIGEFANMAGVALAVPLGRVMGKKGSFVFVSSLMAFLSAVFFFVPLTSVGYCMMIVLQIAISICTGIMSPLLWSMYADVVDYSELHNGVSSAGLIFSSSSMAQKFGGALSGAAVLWLLDVYGYSVELTGAILQPEAALNCLWYLMSFIPALIALMSLSMILLYPLTTSRVEKISQSLVERRLSVPIQQA